MLLLLPSPWSSLALIIKGHCNCGIIGILQLQLIKHVYTFASETMGVNMQIWNSLTVG
jgi:uncharacterized membrane protein YuzA (DUF378 family)